MHSLANTAAELADTKNVMYMLQEDMQATKEAVLAMKEMLDVWNNTKGFVRTLQVLGSVAKWLLAMGVTVGAIWAAINYRK